MIQRIVTAILIAVAVGLVCLLLGLLLRSLGVPPAAVVGAFLTGYAWVIGLLAGLFYFVRGGLPLP